MPLPAPDHEVRLNWLLHRKWTFPARREPDGGVRSERWVYAVGETPYIVTFTVVTNRYPDGWNAAHKPYGAEESCHREDEGSDYACIFLDGKPCRGDGSGIDAHEWYEAQHKDQQGFVHHAVVFAHLRDLYALWETP